MPTKPGQGQITIQLSPAEFAEAKAVSEKTGLTLSDLIRFGLIEVLAEHQRRINRSVVDTETMSLLIEHEIETGMPIKEQIKAAVKRTKRYFKTP